MDNSPGYHAPQIQRKYLIPLAREFIVSEPDASSVDDFANFIIKSGTTVCTRDNIKIWRKDAWKALRLVNTEPMFQSPRVELLSAQTQDTFNSPGNMTRTDSGTKLSRKRSRTALDSAAADAYTVRLPSISLSDISDTTSTTLRSLGAKLITVSVGTVPSNVRSWMDIFAQAKSNAPCVLHLDDIEGMEKHSIPAGAFRITCLLKSQLLRELIGSGVVLVGETRTLLAGLPQSVVDLFTQCIKFGMLSECHRLSLLQRYLSDNPPGEFVLTTSQQPHKRIHLSEGLTCQELARRTPGYEAGDIIRLIAQLRMLGTLSEDDVDGPQQQQPMIDSDEGEMIQPVGVGDFTIAQPKPPKPTFICGPDAIMDSVEDSPQQPQPITIITATRDLVDECLAVVIPAVKNTAEFVTIPDVTWGDVGGLESIKTQLHNRFMLLIDDWDRAKALNRRSCGVLFEGPPGCGKTLVAKALSNQAGLNFLSVKGPEVLNKFQGESERRIREIFERARACQPCLIFFDEIDAVCPRRDSDETSGSRVSLVNQLLVELDGVDKHRSGRVFVVGATNRKDMIDPAVLRPGRLGLHMFIGPPASVGERESILCACTRSGTLPIVEGGVSVLHEVADDTRTEGMSGADLDNLLELAKQNAQLDKRDCLTRVHLFNALEELYTIRKSEKSHK